LNDASIHDERNSVKSLQLLSRPLSSSYLRALPNLVCGYHLALFRPDQEQVHPAFLAKQLCTHSVIAYYGRLATGSTRYGLSTGGIAKTPLLLPHITHQRKIAKILTTLDNLIEKTESLIAKYQAIKQGMMHDLFARGVDEHGQLRPPQSEAPHLYKNEPPLGWIPNNWTARRLEELYASPIRDFGSFSSTNLITFLDSGIPFIKSEMIEVGNINWTGVTYISEKVHLLLNKSHVRVGDILFSKIGSALGKGVVYEGRRGICNSNAAVAKIDINQQEARRHFITYFLNHDVARTQFQNMIVSLLPRINLGDLNRLIVPCPGIDEQKRIEERLLSSDAAIQSESANLRQCLSLRSGLMQDLLTGKVPVKEDESEEVVP
jgi:type I restriction enzyme, S subunit